MTVFEIITSRTLFFLDTIFSMSSNATSPAVIKFIPAAILSGGTGLIALIWLFLNTRPFEAGYRWLFFLSWFLAVTGSSLPAVAFLNRRFPGRIPATQIVIVRQAAWIGVFAATLAWLQIGRLVNFSIALLLAIGIAAIEISIRFRERGQWRS